MATQARAAIRAIAAICCATAACAAVAQGIGRQVVILGTAGKDDDVCKKLFNPRAPIRSAADLKRLFPNSDYLWLEDDKDWYFIVDRQHRSLRLHLDRAQVLAAFLKKADDKGIVRWGDLSQVVRASALELFSSSAIALKKMGKDADEVRIGLELSLSMSASSADHSAEVTFSPASGGENGSAAFDELTQHPVRPYELSDDDVAAFFSADAEETRRLYGLAVRYIGVNPFGTNVATEAALKAFNTYLRKHQDDQRVTFEGLESKLLNPHIPALGGSVPRRTMSQREVPPDMWRSFSDAIRRDARVHGFEDTDAADRFLGQVTSVQFQVVYTMRYRLSAYTDSKGRSHPASGRAVQVLKS